MKKLYFLFLISFVFASKINAQCDLGNYMGALPIPLASYPYTNAQNITVNAAVVNVSPLVNFTYNCGPNAFAGASPAWWINAANASITLTFSQPVCNFTVLVNGTGPTEEFYFAANNGSCQLMNFCTNNFVLTGGGSSLLCNGGGGGSGTIITCDNPAGATQYVLTHNGLAAGSRVSLLDCYVGCNIVPPANTLTCSLADLTYCAGDNAVVDYVATGPYLPGNIFTAELSDPFGSFAAPTPIGAVAAVVSGSIPCVIPPGALTGSGYRIRVVSTTPPVTGTNNGANITINQFPNVVANASPAAVCAGDLLTLTGGGAVTYVWNGGILNGVAFAPIVTATYTVTGTDAIGCSNTSSITVPVNPLPIINASAAPGNVVCAGSPVTLSGSGGVSYIWNNPVVNNVPFTPAASGTYTVMGTDANNCSNTSTIQITVNPLPAITISANPNDTICAGETITLTASGALSYSWSGGISNGIPFAPGATSVYTVTGTDNNNCSATQYQIVTVSAKPNVNLGPDIDICAGDAVTLDATTPNATYLWQDNTNAQILTANQSGLYWVIVTVNHCSSADSMLLTVNPYPIIDLGPDQEFCDGKSVLLDATCPGCTYTWNINSTQPTVLIDQEGFYKVTVSSKGCAVSDSIYLDKLPLPQVDLGNDTTICPGDVIKLDAFQFGATYIWQDGSHLPTFQVKDIGTYQVEVTLGACKNSDDVLVTYSDKCECPMFVPNAFSPNADALNDQFRLINPRDIELKQFVVYNRWGEEVFSSNNIAIGWEGNYKGVPCESGTYYYLISYKCLYSGKDYVLKGDVTLIR